MFCKLPLVSINYILSFNVNCNILLLRLLSKYYYDLFTDKELLQHILKSNKKYELKLKNAVSAISKYIFINKDFINDNLSKYYINISVFDFKSIPNKDKQIYKLSKYLVKNKSVVLINDYSEYTILYYSSHSGDLIENSFGENYVDVCYIDSTDTKYINKYNLTNYEIFNNKIYFLLITCPNIGNKYGICLTYNEAMSLNRAFTKATYIS